MLNVEVASFSGFRDIKKKSFRDVSVCCLLKGRSTEVGHGGASISESGLQFHLETLSRCRSEYCLVGEDHHEPFVIIHI